MSPDTLNVEAMVEEALERNPEVNVCVSDHVFAVVVPNAIEMVFAERESGYVNVSAFS